MYFDGQRNYLITASYDDGVLAITDLQKPGKERYSAVIANLEGKSKVDTKLIMKKNIYMK